MASLSSPIGPTIDVVSKTISRSVISGGGGGQRGGAIVPVNRMVDPGALLAPPPPPTVNPEEVGALKKQISALVKRDSEQLAAYNNLIGFLQNQFKTIGVTVTDLGSNLNATNKLLQNDAQLEQQQQTQEVVEQKRAAESQYRKGAEKLLEQKIQAALMAPVKAIGNKLQLTLGNLMRFFGILFTGWLVDKAIELFKADSEGNKRKFEDIKNTIIKNLFIAGGVLAVLNIGIFRIAGKVTSLAFKLSRFVLSNTLGKLFSSIGALAGRVANATKTMLGIGAKPAATAADVGAGAGAAGKGAAAVEDAAAAAGKGAAAAEGLLGKTGKVLKNAAGPLNVLAGGLSFFDRKEEGQTNTQAGTGAVSEVLGGEAAAAAAAKLPIPNPILKFGAIGAAYFGGSFLGGKVSDVATGVGNTSPKTTPPVASKSTPVTPAKPSPPTVSTTPSPTVSSPQNSSVPQYPSAPTAPTAPSSSNVSSPSSTTEEGLTETYQQVSYPQAPIIPEYPPEPTTNNVSTPISPSIPTTPSTPSSSTSATTSTQPVAQPTAEMVKNFEMAWQYRNNPMARGRIEGAWKNMSPQEQQMAVVWAQSKGYNWAEMKLPAPAQVQPQPQQSTTGTTSINQPVSPQQTGTGAEITPPPTSQIVGSSPPPKPNVIYASSGKDQSSGVKAPMKSGPASDVPFISSSNPDNFYLLYSQVQYNIVG